MSAPAWVDLIGGRKTSSILTILSLAGGIAWISHFEGITSLRTHLTHQPKLLLKHIRYVCNPKLAVICCWQACWRRNWLVILACPARLPKLSILKASYLCAHTLHSNKNILKTLRLCLQAKTINNMSRISLREEELTAQNWKFSPAGWIAQIDHFEGVISLFKHLAYKQNLLLKYARYAYKLKQE